MSESPSSSSKTPPKRKSEGTTSENAKGGTDPKQLKPTTMPTKDPAPDEHGGEVTTQEDRMGAVGGTDTGATGTRAFLYSHLTTKNAVLRYKRTWNFYAFPYCKQMIDFSTNKSLCQNTSNKVLTTSMAVFPTDLPFLYMSPAEYTLLPSETKVVKTYNKISVVHASTSFKANESNVANVTASNQLLLDYTKGAVLKGVGTVCSYTTSDSDPMIPVGAESWGTATELNDWATRLWDGFGTTPPATTGVWTELPAYLALHLDGNGSATSNGYVDCDQLYGSCNAVTNYNTDFMQHKEHYSNTYLTNQRNLFVSQAYAPESGTHTWPMKCRGTFLESTGVGQDSLWEPNQHSTTVGQKLVPYAYNHSFITPNAYRIGHKSFEPDRYPPWLYVGLREIPAIAKSGVEFQDGVVYFQYECEMVVSINFDSYTHKLATKSYSDALYHVPPPLGTGQSFVTATRTGGRFGNIPYLHKVPAKEIEEDMVIV